MYAVGNVKKFLEDNVGTIDKRKAAGILQRAEAHKGQDGVIVSQFSLEIWQDADLYQQFRHEFDYSHDHLNIVVDAM